MTREQMIAWLTLEGWEPRWFVRSGGPTIANSTHWVGHMYGKVRPIAEHPEGDRPTMPASWDQVNSAYFDKVWAALGEQK